jgi:hypothetical protein
MNGGSASSFALDMGISLKAVLGLEPTTLTKLAALGGLSEKALNDLVSWTGNSIGDIRMMFRDEIYVSRALMNPIVRGCPACLRQDAEGDQRNPHSRMAMRGDWQLQEVDICVRHHHPLVPLWSSQALRDRYDSSVRLAGISQKIINGELDQPPEEPSEYDLWLSKRLETGQDETWLSTQSLFAATTFCRLLGNEMCRSKPLPVAGKNGQNRSAHAAGFAIAAQGESAILEAFDFLISSATGSADRPQKAFGSVLLTLGRTHLEEPAFGSLRHILRNSIIANWPVGAGEVVLGIAQTERELHSIHSASAETGIGISILEQFLAHAGAISLDDDKPIARQTFDAKRYANLLAEIPTLVSRVEMRHAMGATKVQLRTLEQDGVLIPRIDIPTIKSPWRVSDGTALIAELDALAVQVAQSDNHWEAIQQAKSRTSLSVGSIIAAIREGNLQLGRRAGTEGYSFLCVLKTEINAMKRSLIPPEDVIFVSAAAFSRSVGMRGQGWFENLANAGLSPATRRPHPKWHDERTYLSEQDIEAFHKRFFTLTTMVEALNENRQTLLVRLKTAGVTPFRPNGRDCGALYLRNEVEAAFA